MFDPDEQTDDDNQRNYQKYYLPLIFFSEPSSIIINPEFEGLPNDQLLNLANWVHHVPYLLPQGRTVWENPYAKGSKDENDDDDGSDRNSEQDASDDNNAGSEGMEPESGPPMLNPANADDGLYQFFGP